MKNRDWVGILLQCALALCLIAPLRAQVTGSIDGAAHPRKFSFADHGLNIDGFVY